MDKVKKDAMEKLPEEGQEALARMTLARAKERARLERVAEGSRWTKWLWFLPVAVMAAAGFVSSSEWLPVALPVIGMGVLLPIFGLACDVHARIDAVWRILKEERGERGER